MASERPPEPRDPFAPHSSTPRELKARLEAAASGGSFLGFRDDAGELQIVLLPSGDAVVTVGRGNGCHVRLPWDARVSAVHAALESLGGVWALVDDGLSTNGTFINGARVSGRARLRDGDRIRVGRTLIAFSSAPQAGGTTTIVGNASVTGSVRPSQRPVLVALCRPTLEQQGMGITPTNQQIADELNVSIDAVKMHLRALFAAFDLDHLSQNQKRSKLAEIAVREGLVTRRDM